MKTRIFPAALAGLLLPAVCAQTNGPPTIEWDKSFGAPGKEDCLYDLVLTVDGGFLLVGSSVAYTGGGLAPSGWVCWLVRLDAEGNRLWDKFYGGSCVDAALKALPAADGGFVIGGFSCSEGGHRSPPYYGSNDYWVMRLDASGDRVWDQSFGGNYGERGFWIEPTTDGGYVMAGPSWSFESGCKTAPNYDPTANTSDMWIVRLDSQGNQLWDQSFGGTKDDEGKVIRQTVDGGFIVGGSSASPANTGNKTSPFYGPIGAWLYRGSDFWVVRLGVDGNTLWDQSYGGAGRERVFDVQPSANGGYVLAGYSSSAPVPASTPEKGNKTSPCYGGNDYWVVWIDADGHVLRDRSYGGAGDDRCLSLLPMPEGGWILCGQSNSQPGGTKTSPNYGSYDYWLVRIDAEGYPMWDQSFGGSRADGYDFLTNPPEETPTPIKATKDGGFVLAGYSKSPPSGNKTAPLDKGYDYWVVKLGPEPPFLRAGPIQPDGLPLTVIGPTNRVFALDSSADLAQWTELTQLTNLTGKVAWKDEAAPGQSSRFYRAVVK